MKMTPKMKKTPKIKKTCKQTSLIRPYLIAYPQYVYVKGHWCVEEMP